MIAFEKYVFRDFDNSDVLKLHREWLKDYEGLYYSKGEDGYDLILWQKEKEKYVYSDKVWSPSINKIQRHPRRLIIEFDNVEGEPNNAKEGLEKVRQKFKRNIWGYIISTHNSKNSDYLWCEFSRNLTEEEARAFLEWICPKGHRIDLNFSKDNMRFPVMFGIHWKYSYEREMPVKSRMGDVINFDNLNIKSSPKKAVNNIKNKGKQSSGEWIKKVVSKVKIEDLANEFGVSSCPRCSKGIVFDNDRGFFCCQDWYCDFKGNIVKFVEECR